jgi:hypothetical protein
MVYAHLPDDGYVTVNDPYHTWDINLTLCGADMRCTKCGVRNLDRDDEDDPYPCHYERPHGVSRLEVDDLRTP